MSDKLKVAYLLGTFPGLTQTFVVREIYWIRKHHIEPAVFSLFMPKELPTEKKAKELMAATHYSPYMSLAVIKAMVYFFVFSPMRMLRALVRIFQFGFREPKLMLQALATFPKSVFFARKIKMLEVEHIHTHFVSLASFSAGTISELLGISFTVHAHAADVFSRNMIAVTKQMEKVSGIITISNFHKEFIANLSSNIVSSKIDVVYCGLETEAFIPAATEPKENKPIRILSIGRLIEKKGFEYLIDACAELFKENLLFRCEIGGSGPLYGKLQRKINQYGLQNNVTLLGAVQQDEVIKLYQENDIFVLPCVVGSDGNRDGLPVVLIEALSCELPVITTPITGIVDLVEDQKTGLLVKERDALGLAMAIKSLMFDETTRSLLGKQGREKVLGEFQVQDTTAKLANAFRKYANQNSVEL